MHLQSYPHTVAKLAHRVVFEVTPNGIPCYCTVYRWMLSTAVKYVDRQTDERGKIGRNVHINLP
jgi:hypothetical protein